MKNFVSLNFVSTMKKFMPESPGKYPINPGVTVKELFAELGIPSDATKLVFINGVRKDTEYILNGGEKVGIFPPLSGG
ncbi:MAG: MoaD/ThiS family protein [Desulfobacterales bacterium]|nr:MoaD/ThiS family protein [Desulfobacterales bacterium]